MRKKRQSIPHLQGMYFGISNYYMYLIQIVCKIGGTNYHLSR